MPAHFLIYKIPFVEDERLCYGTFRCKFHSFAVALHCIVIVIEHQSFLFPGAQPVFGILRCIENDRIHI